MKNKENVSDLDCTNGKAVTDKEKAEELNRFFKKVFTEEDTRTIPTFQEKPVDYPLTSVHITEKNSP